MNPAISGIMNNIANNVTGNVPKAILCVKQMNADGQKSLNKKQSVEDTAKKADAVQKRQLSAASEALNSSQTYQSLGKKNIFTNSGYLAMEVQYNPSSIYLDTQAGKQVQYSAGNLGSESNNQIVQVIQPVSTTMSFQLIFDQVNVQDAFMAENLNPTLGNAISGGANLVKKLSGKTYSVQTQIDGLMSLLTQDETRHVIFYWAHMCFRGEVTSVSSRYTMFNKDGNPIRGVVDMSLRQGNEEAFSYDETYWNQAFNKAFGVSSRNVTSGTRSTFNKVTQNNLLNLNI